MRTWYQLHAVRSYHSPLGWPSRRKTQSTEKNSGRIKHRIEAVHPSAPISMLDLVFGGSGPRNIALRTSRCERLPFILLSYEIYIFVLLGLQQRNRIRRFQSRLSDSLFLWRNKGVSVGTVYTAGAFLLGCGRAGTLVAPPIGGRKPCNNINYLLRTRRTTTCSLLVTSLEFDSSSAPARWRNSIGDEDLPRRPCLHHGWCHAAKTRLGRQRKCRDRCSPRVHVQ